MIDTFGLGVGTIVTLGSLAIDGAKNSKPKKMFEGFTPEELAKPWKPIPNCMWFRISEIRSWIVDGVLKCGYLKPDGNYYDVHNVIDFCTDKEHPDGKEAYKNFTKRHLRLSQIYPFMYT